MSTTPDQEKKAAILASGVMGSLVPQLPDTIKFALSAKQNFAVAAEEIFCHALNRTIWGYRNDYEAVMLIVDGVRNVSMEGLATEQGLAEVVELVFGNAATREFIFTLQTQFFSQFAEFHTHWNEMIGYISLSLTNGLLGTSAEVDERYSLVPEELRLRMLTPDRMKQILLANNWLVMFIFISLWGRVYTYEELRAFQRSAKAG